MCTDGEGIGQPIKVSECDRTTAPGLTGVGIAVRLGLAHADWLLQHQALTIANLSVIGWYIYVCSCMVYSVYIYIHTTFIKYTSSTAQGGGGSFKNRKPIGEIGCCESGMAERSH